MKKLLFLFFTASALTFASCDSKKENAVEENAEMKEDAADDADNAPAEQAAEAQENSVDAADPQ